MAPGPNDSGSAIVVSRPGRLTGETLYCDARGQWWTTEVPQRLSTGESLGYMHDGRIEKR